MLVMKILDRYIAKNFLVGYAISFCVLIGLRIIIDLFVNLDEFTEHANLGTWAVVRNVFTFYALNATLYFRDIAGVIAVVAAAFSLGKMVRTNELVAIIASGVSAQRIVGPLLVLAALFTAVAVADQEFLIPSISDKLVRDHDDPNGTKAYGIWFMTDGNGSLICSNRYEAATATLHQPTIITREVTERPGIWKVTGRISADSTTYNEQTDQWDLANGFFLSTDPTRSADGAKPMASYSAGNLLPRDIPVRRNAGYDSLLSWWHPNELARQGTKIKDVAQLSSQKHFRITDPIINLTMLMVSLPVLICRDPKSMKSAIIVSFVLTSACFVTTFVCKMLATEVPWIMPELWAWLPLFIFVTIAIIELDSMKT
jgi:lipopolysaccharide export system permease protein